MLITFLLLLLFMHGSGSFFFVQYKVFTCGRNIHMCKNRANNGNNSTEKKNYNNNTTMYTVYFVYILSDQNSLAIRCFPRGWYSRSSPCYHFLFIVIAVYCDIYTVYRRTFSIFGVACRKHLGTCENSFWFDRSNLSECICCIESYKRWKWQHLDMESETCRIEITKQRAMFAHKDFWKVTILGIC